MTKVKNKSISKKIKGKEKQNPHDVSRTSSNNKKRTVMSHLKKKLTNTVMKYILNQ